MSKLCTGSVGVSATLLLLLRHLEKLFSQKAPSSSEEGRGIKVSSASTHPLSVPPSPTGAAPKPAAPVDPWGGPSSAPPVKSSDPWASNSGPASDPWGSAAARPKASNAGGLSAEKSSLHVATPQSRPSPQRTANSSRLTLEQLRCFAQEDTSTCLLAFFLCRLCESSLLSFTPVRVCVCVRLCLFPSVCVSVCVCVVPFPGSFGLFTSSNGTSKEDFSEFDSLRSSSSVPTGTHPCLCLSCC